MCFDLDSRPPIAPIAGGALDSRHLTLRADDGTQFTAFHARAAEPTGSAIVILPDVRGLHPYYEDLALRFAENGVDALAVDYFGRTAGLAGHGKREAGFEFAPHAEATTFEGLSADLSAAVAHLRAADGDRARNVFAVGFCFGGRLAFVSATLGLDLAGVIGFYGKTVGPGRGGVPAPVDVAERMASPVLGLFGGADTGIQASDVAAFEAALQNAGVEHKLVTYEGAPHSFFDRKADEFVRASESAWSEVLEFVRAHDRTTA